MTNQHDKEVREAFEARHLKMYGKKPRIYHDGKYYGAFQSLWEEYKAGYQAATAVDASLEQHRAQSFDLGYESAEATYLPVIEKLVEALTQMLDDGDHISDYVAPNETPVFNRNEKQGYYCYAAAEQAMDALTLAAPLLEEKK